MLSNNIRITQKYKNKFNVILFIFIIMLMVSYAGISACINITIDNQPLYALTSTGVTNLSTNQGLIEGANPLRLGDIATQTLAGNAANEGSQASQTITINHSQMLDLYINGSLHTNKGEKNDWSILDPLKPAWSAKYSPNATISNTTDGNGNKDLILKTYPRLGESNIVISSRIRVSNSLQAAIRDPMLKVSANVRFITTHVDNNQSYGTVTLKWSDNPPQDTVIQNNFYFSGTNDRSLNSTVPMNSIGANSYLQLEITNLKQDNVLDGKSHEQSHFDYTKSGICIHFDEIIIEIKIEQSEMYYRQTLQNFADVTVVGINRDDNCARDIVKIGDYIYVSTNFTLNNKLLELSYANGNHYVTYDGVTVLNEFRNYFITGSNTNNISTIEWDFNSDFLERVIDDDFDITGQTAKFRVRFLETNMVNQLRFTPYLRKVDSAYPDNFVGLTPYTGYAYVTLRGDAAPPNDPQIRTSDPFYINNFEQKQWYSKGYNAQRGGVEINVNMTSASFDPGPGALLKVFYTTDGSNPTTSDSRELLVNQPISAATSTNVKLFFPLPGATRKQVFDLKFVTYDLAGNISSVVTFDEIKIDCTDYLVSVYFSQGDIIPFALANSQSVATLGAAQLGTYVSDTNKNYSSTKNDARRAYRRGDLIYIRLTFKKNSPFRLFSYYNSGIRNVVSNNINYGNFAIRDFGDFDEKNASEVYLYAPGNQVETAILLSDEMADNLNSLNFYFFFKRQLDIMVGATEKVYDGLPKGIDQPTTNLSGIDIVTYYKQNEQDAFVSTDRFTNAGNYFYKCEIVSSNFYGTSQGPFIIHKADPYITGLQVLDIVYGNSMGSATIRCVNTDVNTPTISYNLNYSSDRKVQGDFMITYPVVDTASYNNPSQGLKDITVTFYPKPSYAINYNSMAFQTTLYVNYSNLLVMTFEENTFTYTYQKDIKRYASVKTTPPNQMLIYEYKREGQPDSAYTTNEPIDAGIYEVRVRTDLALSNYDNMITTEGTGLKFVINRQPLIVSATPAVAYYQNDFDPLAQAYLETQSGNQMVPISDWRYEYKVNGSWVNQRPVDSGVYEAKVIINSIDRYGIITGNYVGETITTLTIKKGNADATTDFQIIYPQPINNPSINGNISYGQKLSEINLTAGSGYVARYMFRFSDQQGNIYYDQRIVDGEFFVADRLYNPAIDASVAAFVNEMKNKILPVARYTSTTALYITFAPDDLVNFNLTTARINVSIVMATPMFHNIATENLIYGDVASQLIVKGFSKEAFTKPVYTISDVVTIDDKVINPTVNGMPITGKLHFIDQENRILSAGQQLIAFRFVPDDENNIRIVSSFNIPVNVEKAMLELEAAERENLGEDEYITRTYGNLFFNPLINIYKNISGNRIKDNNFNIAYTYYNSLGNIVTLSSLTVAGTYTMRVDIINNNYQGELEETIIIQKATPVIHTPPQTGTIRYGMDMTNVVLGSGRMQHPVTYHVVAGRFEFYGIPPTPMQVGEVDYDVVFIPTDLNNYNEVNLSIRIRVHKAFATIALSNLTHIYTGSVQNPSYTTNIVIRTDGSNEYYVDLNEPGNQLTEFDRYLSVELRYNTASGNIPVNAGVYIVTARINDAYFEGVLDAEYVINQAEAQIIVDETSMVQAYNSGIISLRASARDIAGNIINVLISQSFTGYNNVELQDAPRNVGVYGVKLDIRDTNYKGTAVSALTITISQLSIHNTVQTYGIKPPILVEYLPNSASSRVSYQRISDTGEMGDITETQPTNAGRYKIIIHFAANLNNGYTGTFESELNISKAQVSLSYNGVFEYNYIGENRARLITDVNSIRVTPSPLYTLKRNIEFYNSATEQFTSNEPLQVGVYIMKVTIDDINYAGEAEFTYTINKGTPSIRVHPIVQPIIYTDNGSDAVIQGGEVIFNGQIKTGRYSLVENTMNLEVGTHNVMYCFIPDDYHNLKEVYGVTQVTVLQKDIGDFIVFKGENSVEYNTMPHYITASISTGESVIIDIFYNRSKSAPRERGTYTVTAEIIDKNYKGEAEWNKKLVIREGEPMIVAPRLSDIYVGNSLSYSQLQGGYAYIKGTGEFIDGKLVDGTATVIPGVFAFINPNRIMNEANYRTVQLSFKPFASSNFSNITFYTEIRVIGVDPTIGNVATSIKEEGQIIYYGQPLSNFNIFFTDPPVENATQGVLSFADQNVIPKVGQTVTYRFYPTDDKLYNIIEGQVPVTITKAQADVQHISAKAFYGQSLRQAVFNAVMLNRYNSSVPVDGDFELLSVEGFSNLNEVLTVNNVALIAGGNGTPVLQGTYRFTSNNYDTIEGSITISCYQLLNDINITVHNISKSFNALPIEVQDLDITTSFTQHPLFDDNYIITVFDSAGNVSEGIEVGVYSVVIEIMDIMYYGKKTITFEITKADISSYLSLSYTSAEFGSAMSKPSVIILSDNFGEITQNNFVVEFKRINESVSSYNETMPSQAGIYDVRVRVVNNAFFSGQKVFTFTIEKKSASVQVSGMIQNYGNAGPINVTYVQYDLVPTVTYYSNTYNRTTAVPTEAGDYIARVEIIHNNYTIRNGPFNYVEVSFRILQASLTLRNRPLVSDITYGQRMKDSIIVGGLITFGDNVTVTGKYEFVNPEHKPNAGQQSASVMFVPYNKNFASLRIDDIPLNVLRANAEIIFTRLTTVYDGQNKSDAIRYVSDSDAEWEIIFLQNGNIVNPVNAGVYQVMVRILSSNYQIGVDIQGNPVLEKLNAATFVIDKASMRDFTLPIPTSVVFGQSLAYSTLNSNSHEGYGIATYNNIDGYVNGSFSYVNSGLVLGNAGVYIVDIIFYPTDSNNHNSFKTKIEVRVTPSPATITVSNNVYIYGTPITLPTFTTNPGNLTVAHNMDILGQIVDCGSYKYRAWVTSPNYDDPGNFTEFDIIILKKEVRISFVQNDLPVEKYFTTYQKILNARAVVNINDVITKDLYSQLGVHINQRIDYNYYSVPKSDGGAIIDYGRIPPSNIGDYRVVAVMNHDNYYGTASIYYDINLGEIEEIYFDSYTLEQQVYGNVKAPIITTKPANVSYWIDYKGQGQVRPEDAGTYNIVVYFNDPNYVPRHVSAMFKIQKKELRIEDIEVESKVYDGVSSLAITGKINGVMLGDEVKLLMRARTEGGKVNVGSHKVEITSYTISGLSAKNYYLAKPYYAGTIEIYERKIVDNKTQSFITSSNGFSSGVTVEFKEIVSPNNGENIFTNLLGPKATVKTFLIKENNLSTTLNERVKVYVKIPDQYLNVKNLKVEGLGNLSDQQPRREGEYYTFYTDTSGEIVFSSNDFSYWVVGVIAVAVAFIIGVILLFWLNPRHKKSKTSDDTAAKKAIKRIKKGYYK